MEENDGANFYEYEEVLAVMAYTGKIYQSISRSIREDVEYMQQLNIRGDALASRGSHICR